MATRKKIGSTVALTLVLCLALVATAAAKGELRLAIQPTTVLLGETVTARVQIEGKVAGRPQLTGLGGLTLIGQSEQSGVQFVQGALTVKREFVFSLRATKPGVYKVRAKAPLGGGKTARSRAVTLRVVEGATTPAIAPSGPGNTPPASGGKPYFIDTRVSNGKPYLGQMVLVEFHLYLREGIQPLGNLDILNAPEFVGFTNYELPKSNQLHFTPATVDGREYRVALVQRFAVFPNAVGELPLGKLAMRFRVMGGRGRQNGFMGLPMFRNGKAASVESDEAKVDVQPLPTAGKPADFSGAVGKVELTARLDSRRVGLGEPVALKLTASGHGTIETLRRPEIDLPPGLRVYSESDRSDVSPGADNVTGTKTFEIVLVADEPGDKEIAGIAVNYFDPEAGAYAKATTGPLSLTVRETGRGAAQTQLPIITRESVELRGRDLRYIHKDKDALRQARRPLSRARLFWVWVALWPLVATGVIVWQIRSGRLRADRGGYRSRRAMKEARTRLKATRGLVGDGVGFYTELHRVLLGFVADKFNAYAPGLELHEVIALLTENEVSAAQVEAFSELWREADAARFAGVPTDTDARLAALKRTRQLLADLAEELTS
jgi:BatD DUF11 like domain